MPAACNQHEVEGSEQQLLDLAHADEYRPERRGDRDAEVTAGRMAEAGPFAGHDQVTIRPPDWLEEGSGPFRADVTQRPTLEP